MDQSPEKRLLDNGIPLVVERLPHLRSVSLGVWVETGTRDEFPHEHGISHFLEHTFFKGTATRSAERIAQEIDGLGGEMNAFTSREQTAFYTKVLSDRLDEATDLLTDILTRSTFEPELLDRERQVVVEEIRMVEDDPEEWVHDLHGAHMWGGDTPLGRNILGTEASVAGLGPEQIRAYLARRYTPDQMVVSAAGNLDPEQLFAHLNATLGQMDTPAAGDTGPGDAPAPTGGAPDLHYRELEQVHVCVGARSLSMGHPDRFGMYVLNDALGGGSSSRLFQEIREKRGLAYSVYSGLSSYRDCGELTIYAGCSGASLPQVGELIRCEIDRLCDTPVPEDELQRIKGHLQGTLVLGLESTFNRMSRLAQDELQWRAPQSLDSILEQIERVDAEQVMRLARFAFDPAYVCPTILGALKGLPNDLFGPLPVRG